MKKAAFAALVVFVIGFTGLAHADAIFDFTGMSGGTSLEFTGTLKIDGINKISDLQEGLRYGWAYDLTYTTYEGEFVGASSHAGYADCTFAYHWTYDDGIGIIFSLLGDDDALLTTSEDTRWKDPFGESIGRFMYAGLNQRKVQGVPEPSGFLIIASGLIGFLVFRKKIA